MLLILELLQVRIPIRVSVIVGGLACLKQRNQTAQSNKALPSNRESGKLEFTALKLRQERIANLLCDLDVFAPLFQQSWELPTAATVQRQRPVGDLVV